MKHILIMLFLLAGYTANAYGQRPKDGVYTYRVAFAEWNGQSMGATVLVKIKGDSIYIIHNGGSLSGKKGEVIESGIIMKHRSTGKWIIGHTPADRNAKDIGGCSDGPAEIDFINKKYWLC